MFWVCELLRELQGGSISACKERPAGSRDSRLLSTLCPAGLGVPSRCRQHQLERRGRPVGAAPSSVSGPHWEDTPQTSLTPIISC